MFNYFLSALKDPKSLTTYNTGLLQTKAYRALKNRTTELLKSADISTLEWAFLGLLYDFQDGYRLLVVAQMLGVEQSFVTVMVGRLKKKKYLEMVSDPEDARAKFAKLTDEGRKFVILKEKELRRDMKPLLKNVSIKEVLIYLKVLHAIVDNSALD